MANRETRRSVIPNKDVIEELRKQRAWSIERLSQEADIGMRTAQKVVAGEPVSMDTLTEVAAALGVKYADLLLSGNSEQPRRTKLQVVIQGDMAELNQHPLLSEFVVLLKSMIGSTGAIQIIDVKDGSLIITLEMDEADALRLAELFPDFHEHARDVIRATPEGKAVLEGIQISQISGLAGGGSKRPISPGVGPDSIETTRRLLRMVYGVSELRILADPEPVLEGDQVKKENRVEEPPPPSRVDAERMNALRKRICSLLWDEVGIDVLSHGVPGLEPVVQDLLELVRLEVETGDRRPR